MLSRIISRIVGFAVAVFYDVERAGPPLAPGPVLVAANHPNALIDPLVIFRTGGRASRPLAKAPLFDQLLVGTVLRGLGGLPVYRKSDDPSLMHLNERTFDAAIGALQAREAVQIFPEGRSHSEPSLTRLRTGAARIALLAEERAGWSLDLRVQAVGLTYTRKHLFRGRVLAVYGAPFPVAAARAAHEADPREAARDLTERIARELEAVTLNLDADADREIVEAAERLYAREKRWAAWRERAPLAERLPRLQRFAAGLRWLRATRPDELQRLQEMVRRYLRFATLFGAHEGDVPPRYRPRTVAAYVVRQALRLTLLMPVALVGTLAWALPFLAARHLAPLFRPKLDQVATYKLGVALVAFPMWVALITAATFWSSGSLWAATVLLLLPATGLAAIAWRERQERVLEDARVFLRALAHPRGRDRLAELRAHLVEEFDRLAAAWEAQASGAAAHVDAAAAEAPGGEGGVPDPGPGAGA